ncbi:MAG TPA: hypothetical protein VEL28_17875 [Candidatus Binatia bacterium]|nr:hypothetical protein [Candidatus Binatia bacterium]
MAAFAIVMWKGSAIAAFSTTSSSSTTTEYLTFPVQCEYDLLLPEGGSFETLSILIDDHWPSPLHDAANCSLSPGAGSAKLEIVDDLHLEVSELSSPIPPGTVVARCFGTTTMDTTMPPFLITYDKVRVWGVAATTSAGEPVRPPRICVAAHHCDIGVPRADDWIPGPFCGDADFNGRLEASDALWTLSTAVGILRCKTVATSCDSNGNGQITGTDALITLRKAVGLEVEMNCPVPCLPGTIGPDKATRRFSVVLELMEPDLETLGFVLGYSQAVGQFADFPTARCTGFAGFDVSVTHNQNDRTLTGTLSHTVSDHAQRFVTCRFDTPDRFFPEPSDFSLQASTIEGEPVEAAIRISEIRAH